jgi:hypothetical protein
MMVRAEGFVKKFKEGALSQFGSSFGLNKTKIWGSLGAWIRATQIRNNLEEILGRCHITFVYYTASHITTLYRRQHG